MNIYIAGILLGLVQGFTEFLPISSTGHLIVLESLWQLDENIFNIWFNVFVHAGSLLAVIIYFYKDIWQLIKAIWQVLLTRQIKDYNQKVAVYIILGTIPAGIIGYLLKDIIANVFYSTFWVAVFLILFSIIYGLIEFYYKKQKETKDHVPHWQAALLIALVQDIALFPGVSRSGITYTTGLLFKLKRETAAKFAFLLSIPIILGATVASVINLQEIGNVNWLVYFMAALAAAFSGWLSIKMFMNIIVKKGLKPFLIYRIILGFLLLMFF